MQSHRPLPPRGLRHQFSSDRLETASSSTILVLCFERLDRDLAMASTAIADGDHYTTNEHLGHAQDLLGEVATMLDPTAWEHAGSLLAVYDYVLRLIAQANITKSDALVREAQRLLAEIGDAFRSAARAQHEAPVPSHDDAAPPPRLSVQA